MINYFATFVTGCQDIVAARLRQFPNADVVVQEVHDGLVLFTATLSEAQLTELRFLNNVYSVIADLGVQKNLEESAQLAAQSDMSRLPNANFKVSVRLANQPTAIATLPALQMAVADATGGRLDTFRPEVEYFLLQRADGRTLWGRQLPRPGFKSRRLEAGELRPEFCHIMGLLAGLDRKHTVLDPFAGYGAIVRECLQGFHAEEVIAVEYNEHLVPHLKSIPRLIAKHGDAARLPHIETRSIDRIITDPPWGKYEHASPEHLEHLYYEAFIQMHRVLRTKGCAVMVTAVPFIEKIAAEMGFTVEKVVPTLVNGQKTTLYKLRKLAA